MKFVKNRSQRAECLYCEKAIPYGVPCMRLKTYYLYHDSVSIFLHHECVEKLARSIRKLKEESSVKYVAWKLENDKDQTQT